MSQSSAGAVAVRLMLCLGLIPLSLQVAEAANVSEAIVFRATFDRSTDADIAKGDNRIHTAETLDRKNQQPGLHAGSSVEWKKSGGRTGGALRFHQKTKQLVFFKGGKNVPYRKSNFQGTVSVWMRLLPREDLPKGYVDPLQITDKKWNDASFFVDFDQTEARDFRLGVFSDFKFWNPTAKKYDDIPPKERPMVVVSNPPFEREKWTHVAFTWSSFNSEKRGEAVFYLNGKPQGSIQRKQQFSWDPEQTVIMLGINYVGWVDDLVIYNRALSLSEIKTLGK